MHTPTQKIDNKFNKTVWMSGFMLLATVIFISKIAIYC